MKKVVYFFVISLIATSCQLLKNPVYDDVYSKAVIDADVDETNGYVDYIKKQEKKYTVKPDSAHHTWAGDGYVNRTDPFSKSAYCYTHNFTHTRAEAGPYCNFNAYNGLFNPNSPFYQKGYNYNIYNQYNCYNYNYNPFGFNNYCGYIVYGSGYNNFGYYGTSNYYGNPYYGYNYGYPFYPYTNNNSNNSWANNPSNEMSSTTTGYHYTGHRSANYSGTYNSNNTSYPNTVKSIPENSSLPTIETNPTPSPSPKIKKQSLSQTSTVTTTKATNKWDVVSYNGTSRTSTASKYKVPVSNPPRTYSSNPARTSYYSGGGAHKTSFNTNTKPSSHNHSSGSSSKGSSSSGRSGTTGSSSRR